MIINLIYECVLYYVVSKLKLIAVICFELKNKLKTCELEAKFILDLRKCVYFGIKNMSLCSFLHLLHMLALNFCL